MLVVGVRCVCAKTIDSVSRLVGRNSPVSQVVDPDGRDRSHTTHTLYLLASTTPSGPAALSDSVRFFYLLSAVVAWQAEQSIEVDE